MYTVADLKKYKYFKGADLNFVLDSLTGVISRQYILDFARELINDKIPFAMCMMDLDNFKYINDSYGHNAGDICLKTIGENLQKYVGEDGLVGRFGGDEFIIIYLKSIDYDDIHDFFAGMYGDTGAVRRRVAIDNVRVFVTATLGCATYPKDSQTYDELFSKMDKALYRGKSKGRNCYIIYVHEKHKDIVVSDRGTNSLLNKIQYVRGITEEQPKDKVISTTIEYLFQVVHPAQLFFVDNESNVISAKDKNTYHFGKNASFLLNRVLDGKDILPSSSPKVIKDRFPDTVPYMVEKNIHAFVIARVGDYGYIVIYENAVTRMWQDYDLVLIDVASTFLKYALSK